MFSSWEKERERRNHMGKKERERKWMAIFRIRSFYTWKISVFVKDETLLALHKIFEGFFFFPPNEIYLHPH